MIGKPINAIRETRYDLPNKGMCKVADVSYIYLKFLHCGVLEKKNRYSNLRKYTSVISQYSN